MSSQAQQLQKMMAFFKLDVSPASPSRFDRPAPAGTKTKLASAFDGQSAGVESFAPMDLDEGHFVSYRGASS